MTCTAVSIMSLHFFYQQAMPAAYLVVTFEKRIKLPYPNKFTILCPASHSQVWLHKILKIFQKIIMSLSIINNATLIFLHIKYCILKYQIFIAFNIPSNSNKESLSDSSGRDNWSEQPPATYITTTKNYLAFILTDESNIFT